MQTQQRSSSKGATWGLAILFGVVGASIQSNVSGFFIGAALGALIAQVLYLRSRTQALDEQLQAIGRLLARTKTAPDLPDAMPPQAAAPATAASPAQEPTMADEGEAATAEEELVREAIAAPQPEWTPPPLRAPLPPSALDRALTEFMGWLKRGNPLARLGIVILFFGATFLAKYAADNSLFPIELRFIALALGAFALLIVG